MAVQEESLVKKRAEPSVVRAAGAMSVATFLSRIMGLVREQVFAYFFGAGNANDAFQIAFRIPNLLRDLFAEGAMSASLVPTFTRARHEEGDRRAWRIAGLVFRVLGIGVAVLALGGMIFSEQLVAVYASAFRATPGKFELTVRMTREIFPFFPLVAIAAAFMGILNAGNIFFLPAFASALFNVGSVISGVLAVLWIEHFHPMVFGIALEPIEGMAFGVVVGGAVQAFCQIPALKRMGYRFERRSPSEPLWYRDPRLKKMLWMMLPGTIGLAATQINILVNSVLATSQGTGAVSWLGYSFRLMQFPIGVFGVSIASAVLPRVSRQWVQKDFGGVEATVSQSLRQVFAINLPASVGLAVLGVPLIELIFQYGRFTSQSTIATAQALSMYAVGLCAYSAVKVLVPVCYAVGNTRLPVLSSFLSVGLALILNLSWISWLGYRGLALGTSAAAIGNMIFLSVAVSRLLAQTGYRMRWSPIGRSFVFHLVLSISMGWVCHSLDAALFGRSEWALLAAGRLQTLGLRLVRVGVLVSVGVMWIGAGWWLLAPRFKRDEVSEVTHWFAEKLKKRLARRKT